MEGIFVTGTGTEVGKTVVAATIAHEHARTGERVAVFKPAVTGIDECIAAGIEHDHVRLRDAAGSLQRDDEIAPYRYRPALSPHLAAKLAGERIEPRRLLDTAWAAARGADYLVCEGVGGFLVPLTTGYLVRDLARDLGLPVIIAAAPGLGTINHTLLTLDAVRGAGLELDRVVLTPWPAIPSALEQGNLEAIAALGRVRVDTLPLIEIEGAAESRILRAA